MKLFLISQKENSGYDTYESAVVAAPDEETARVLYPGNGLPISDWHDWRGDWATDPANVNVEYIGEALPGTTQGVICASFNAG